MVDWNPRDHMGLLTYFQFKLGRWVTVETVPDWVQRASNPPDKMDIPLGDYVEATFTGNSLEYRVRTWRKLRPGAGSMTETEYAVRIRRGN